MFVPVISKNRFPLMPTTPSRARRWIRERKATPFWDHGMFCVRLNVNPSNVQLQPIAVGIDPGSKKEGLTVKSACHTFLNIQADAVTWVKKHVETRRMMRRSRRMRGSPCRAPRPNRAHGRIAPSVQSRWQWKLRLVRWMSRMYPLSCCVVEDIKAIVKKGQRRWNLSFSPLQCGKQWFYKEITKICKLETKRGYETKALREILGLSKIRNKLADSFNTHCVDSWVLANWWSGGHNQPDNESILRVTPLELHRRQLFVFQTRQGGIRSLYGGTRSHGFKRGSLVKHAKHGLTYVGGTSTKSLNPRITLHSLETGERVSRDAKVIDCKFLAYNSWRFYGVPEVALSL